MSFIQLIEFNTSKPDEMDDLMDRWMAATEGKRTATRAVLTADRDQTGTYLQIVEFPSYEEAMRNSALPETDQVSQQMSELCDGPVIFRNLDVRREDGL